MSKKVYVRVGHIVGQLVKIDSSHTAGKYHVVPKGAKIVEHFKDIHSRITEQEYNEHVLEVTATKQPAKRGKKNV